MVKKKKKKNMKNYELSKNIVKNIYLEYYEIFSLH